MSEYLKNKVDFALLISVQNANPNGDPLNGNRPRVNFDGHGEISDVCLKRKIRNYLVNNNHENKYEIFVACEDENNIENFSLQNKYEEQFKKWSDKQKEDIRSTVCAQWLDVRTFGQVFAFKSSGKDKNTSSVSIGIRGPLTIQSAFSNKEVIVSSIQITKSVNGINSDKGQKTSDTMGTKHRVVKGLYSTFGAISPQLASVTGFTEGDKEILKDAILNMFEGDGSSARPEGSIYVKELLWITHNSARGAISSAKIQNGLTISEQGKFEISKELKDLESQQKISIERL